LARKGSPPTVDAATAPTETIVDFVVIAIEPVDCDAAGLPAGARIVKIPFRALTKPFLVETNAIIVLGPLLAPELDAMQIAERLGELQFRGTLRLFGPALPNPTLVAREIRSASGSKDIVVELVPQP
jgi:hypothetical protein